MVSDLEFHGYGLLQLRFNGYGFRVSWLWKIQSWFHGYGKFSYGFMVSWLWKIQLWFLKE